MRRSVAVAALLVMVLAPLLWTVDAWARAGGGGSSGSRGSRSYSSPVRPAPSPGQPASPSRSLQQPTPQRSGWGGLGGMLGGLLVGGLIGSLLFGGGWGGGFGGIGLLEIVMVGGLIWLAMSYMRRRQTASPPGYAAAGDDGRSAWQPPARYGAESAAAAATIDAPAAPSDLDRGVDHIRRMDPSYDPVRFAETASDIFFKVQAAWMARDMGVISALLTPEMQATLQRDCDRLRAERRINRLENIAVRTAQVTEAWQESGQDYATVHFLASLLDYTTDESGTQVLEGSRTEPVKFEEYWTFVRNVGANPWRLSAIQQAA
jgi:predicted lipid-binding transport protein (Tim44 family)